MSRSDRKVVLGLGNVLSSDEGVGVHVVRMLADKISHQSLEIEFLDGGVLGFNLLPVVETSSHLLVLDAVDAQQPPGTIIALQNDQLPFYTGVKLSQHQVTFQEVLGLARIRGRLPAELQFIGVQPANLSLGLELSHTVETVIPHFVQRATDVLRQWGKTATFAPA